MKLKTLVLAGILCLGIVASATAQDKVGFANFELILSYMPETAKIGTDLAALQKQLGDKLQVTQNYAETKVAEYEERRGAGETDEQLGDLIKNLQDLDQEIKKGAADAERAIAIRRQEMLQPVLDKVRAAIDKVAKDGGYTYILNMVDATSMSIILHGPEGNNVTELVLKELGVDMSSEGDNTGGN